MRLRHLLLLLLACSIWGFNFIVAAVTLRELPPFLLATLRFVLVAIILLPWLTRPAAGQWSRVLVVSLSMGALHFALMFWALRRSADITSVALLLQLFVPMATLMAVFGLGEVIGWRTVMGVVVSFTGVMVAGLDPLVFTQLDAVALVVISAFFLALGSVLMPGLQNMSAFSLQAWGALLGAPILLALSLLTEPQPIQTITHASWLAWAGVGYSAVASSVMAHAIYFNLLQRYPVTTIMPFFLLTPLIASGFGVMLLGDRPGPRLLIGGALILFGVLVIALRARQRGKELPAAAGESRLV